MTFFAYIQKSQLNSREGYSALLYSKSYIADENPDNYPEGFLPVGSVEFVESILRNNFGIRLRPNFYPDFAPKERIITDDINITKGWDSFFAKKNVYKKVPNKIFHKADYDNIDAEYLENCWYSEVVEFVDEYRIYISQGKIVDIGWYDGKNEDSSPPKLNFDIPEDYYGALDVGILSNGKPAIIESHHPFACGNYLSDKKNYIHWLRDGFKHLTR